MRVSAVGLILLLLLGAASAHGVTNQDWDQDMVLNPLDNCARLDTTQDNDGAIYPASIDAVGNGCQCGDVDDDGTVDIRDLAIYQRALAAAGPGFADLAKCSVSLDPDGCENSDFEALRDVLAEVSSFSNVCRAFVGTLGPPEGLTAVAGDAEILLDWELQPAAEVTGYNVYRSTTEGSGHVLLPASPITESSYIDATVTNGQVYYYLVSAVGATESALSTGEASATPGPTTGPTPVNSDIIPGSGETWTRLGSPYTVTGSIAVRDGATLSIEAGVQVHFALGSSLTISTVSSTSEVGGILALGSEAAPIVFQSTTPSAGQWLGLVLESNISSTSVLDSVHVLHAGEGGVPALSLNAVPASVQLSRVKVDQATAEAVSVVGGAPRLYLGDFDSGAGYAVATQTTAAGLQLLASRVEGGVFIEEDDAAAAFASNVYVGYDAGLPHRVPAALGGEIVGGGSFEGATPQSEVELTDGLMPRSTTWPAFSYRVTQTIDVVGLGAPVLSIEPGTTIRMESQRAFRVASGSQPGGIKALGTESAPIVFKGVVSSPSYWGWMTLNSQITMDSALDHVEILDAGWNGAALRLTGVPSEVVLTNGKIDNTNGDGVKIVGGAPTLDTWEIWPGSGKQALVADAASAPTLARITASGAMYLPSVATVSEIVLKNYAVGPPLQLTADLVGPLMAVVTIEGDDEFSVVKVIDKSITMTATWPAYRYELLQGLNIADASVPILTLDPDVDLRFASLMWLEVGPGGLVAQGTSSEDPIFFQGIGGMGWSTLRLRGSIDPASVLDYVKIMKIRESVFLEGVPAAVTLTNVHVTHDAGSPASGVKVFGGSPVLTNWDIAPDSEKTGIEVINPTTDLRIEASTISGALIFDNGSSTATITGTTFTYDPGLEPSSPLFRLPPDLVASVIQGNTQGNMIANPPADRIIEVLSGNILSDATWNGTYLYQLLGDIDIGSGANPMLTIAAGAVLQLNVSVELRVGVSATGGLDIVGTDGMEVRLERKHQTLNWRSLVFGGQASPASSVSHAIIEDGDTCINIDNSSPTIVDSDIKGCNTTGIHTFKGSPLIEGNTFTDNGTGNPGYGFRCSGFSSARPKIVRNTFVGNGLTGSDTGDIKLEGCSALVEGNQLNADVGINVQAAPSTLLIRNNNIVGVMTNNDFNGRTVDARLNWWGDGVDPETRVSGGPRPVLTNPWLGAAHVGPFQVDTASVAPSVFSAATTATQVRAFFSESADWTLTIESSPDAIFNGTADLDFEQPWSGESTPGVPFPDGVYNYTLTAGPTGSPHEATVEGKMTLDTGLPFARIDLPKQLDTYPEEFVMVDGEVGGTGITGFELKYGPGADPQGPGLSGFTVIESLVPAPVGPTSWSWDTTGLEEGVYTLALVAQGGAVDVEDRIIVNVLRMDPVSVASIFSPELDQLVIRANASVDADWTIEILDDVGGTVRDWSGTGSVIDELWDGVVDGPPVGPGSDGPYSVRVKAVAGGTEVSQVSAVVVLDGTPPSAEITSPVNISMYEEIEVSGTADDANPGTYNLIAEQGAESEELASGATSDVLASTLGTLSAVDQNDPKFSNGMLTLRLEVTDAAGNFSQATTEVDVDRLFISNVAFSPLVFDPYESLGESTLSYDLSHGADVTVTLYPSGKTGLAATLANAETRTEGPQNEIWDGVLTGGGTATNEAYYPVIMASDGTRSVTFNGPDALAAIPEDNLGPLGCDPFDHRWCNLKFNGQPVVFPFAPSDVKPEQNAGVRIDYDVVIPGRHRIDVCVPNCTAPTAREEVLAPVRLPPGPAPFAYWDGKIAGALHQGFYTLDIDNVREIEDAIVFASTPIVQIEELLVNPYVFQPIYGQVANIKLTLTQPADVTIDVYDRDAAFVATVLSSTPLLAGENIEQWDGRSSDGKIVETEGVYELRVIVTDPDTLEVVTRSAVVQVLY